MSKSRAYHATDVKNVCCERLVASRAGAPAVVGLDISKETVVGVVRWGAGDFERPWTVNNPLELGDLVSLLVELNRGRELMVALEPTGTYGDPLRQALADAGLTVHRVSPKASHDYAEIFDGVPSQHDGKDAAIVAELAAIGKSTEWEFSPSKRDEELAYWVDRMESQRRILATWYGRLEGLLARHWPEVTRILRLSRGVLLRCLVEYGGPAGLSADPQARERLQTWSRGRLSAEKVEALLHSAEHSVGVRQGEFAVRRMRDCAEAMVRCRREIADCKRHLTALSAGDSVLQSQGAAVGVVTACVLRVHLGDPRMYDSGAAYRKAMGLNLKERSSGNWVGQLKISKRGPSEVRRWLYFSALRLVRQGDVRAWYDAQRKRREGDRTASMRAMIGVMRKLALALYQVGARGATFDAALLFPGKRRVES